MKTALADYQKSLAGKGELAKWAPTLAGGDPKNGFKIFQSHGAAQCMRCHRHEPGHTEGGEAGPNLMGIALRHNAKGLLESILRPNARISSGFGVATFNLKDNTTKAGLVLAETDTHFDLKEGESIWRIQKSDLKEMPAQTSAMPPMEALLKPQEVRDLVAWLLTLTKESGEKAPAYEVQNLALTKITKTEEPKADDPKPAMTPKNQSENPIPTEDTVSEENTIDQAVMDLGKTQYNLCLACHGADGAGVPNLGPPLAGSEWVAGAPETLISIQLRGISGPITVAGQEYTFPAGMPAMGAGQSDENIASVITYIRNSFGNSASAVTPEMVAAQRGELGQPPLTAAEHQPEIKQEEGPTGPLAEVPSGGIGAPISGVLIFVVAIAITGLAAFRMKLANG
jgi:quinoprotein glucose dehydrogenase